VNTTKISSEEFTAIQRRIETELGCEVVNVDTLMVTNGAFGDGVAIGIALAVGGDEEGNDCWPLCVQLQIGAEVATPDWIEMINNEEHAVKVVKELHQLISKIREQSLVVPKHDSRPHMNLGERKS
jgi:hypothetical protein